MLLKMTVLPNSERHKYRFERGTAARLMLLFSTRRRENNETCGCIIRVIAMAHHKFDKMGMLVQRCFLFADSELMRNGLVIKKHFIIALH